MTRSLRSESCRNVSPKARKFIIHLHTSVNYTLISYWPSISDNGHNNKSVQWLMYMFAIKCMIVSLRNIFFVVVYKYHSVFSFDDINTGHSLLLNFKFKCGPYFSSVMFFISHVLPSVKASNSSLNNIASKIKNECCIRSNDDRLWCYI